MIFVLLVAFQIKHFFADYPLQTSYMLKKFLGGRQWIWPLTLHSGVHALFTLTICFLVRPSMWWLCLLDFVVHFTMDRIKASPNMLGRYKALSSEEYMVNFRFANWHLTDTSDLYNRGFSDEQVHSVRLNDIRTIEEGRKALKHNTYFWWSLGFDQMIHHLTDLTIVYCLVS